MPECTMEELKALWSLQNGLTVAGGVERDAGSWNPVAKNARHAFEGTEKQSPHKGQGPAEYVDDQSNDKEKARALLASLLARNRPEEWTDDEDEEDGVERLPPAYYISETCVIPATYAVRVPPKVVQVEYEMACALNSFTEEECRILSSVDVFDVPLNRQFDVPSDRYNIGSTTYKTHLEVLDNLYQLSPGLMRRNLKQHLDWDDALDMDEITYLRFSRYYRMTRGILDTASKKAFAGFPDLPHYGLGKILARDGTKYKRVFWEGFQVRELPYYLLPLIDAEQHYFTSVDATDIGESDLVITAKTFGDEFKMGIGKLDQPANNYDERTNTISLQSVMSKCLLDGRTIDYEKGRPHNLSLYVRRKPMGSVEQILRPFDPGKILQGIDESNAERNDALIENSLPDYFGILLENLSLENINNFVVGFRKIFPNSIGWIEGLKGLKKKDRFSELINLKSFDEPYVSLCLKRSEPEPGILPFDPGFDAPFAFQDIPCDYDCPYTFFHSIRNHFGDRVQFDEEVGYYVEN